MAPFLIIQPHPAMSRIPHPLPVLLAAAMLMASSMALAQQSPQPPPQPPQQQRDQDQQNREPPRRGSLSDSVRRAERNTRGEVLSAERIQYDGRDMHRVKVVDDQGRVRVFMQEPARRDGNTPPKPRPQRDDD